tara:strand:- start:139 stop:402 length:264 start_codon:yes stop_codon:yes gene_type:complete
MTEIENEDKNYKLAGTLSTVGAVMFVIGLVLCFVVPLLGGMVLILNFFVSTIATILGMTSSNTRAIIVGVIPALMVVFFILVGMAGR